MNKPNGQVMICLCGGMEHHKRILPDLGSHDIRAVFAIPTGFIGKAGFVTQIDVDWIAVGPHFICNYSHEHLWLGQGRPQAKLRPIPMGTITEDCLIAKERLKDHHGDYLIMPFGTANIAGPEHLKALLEHFKWIRLTVGAPLPAEKLWAEAGGTRLYPYNYSGRVIGTTVHADARRPDAVKEAVAMACRLGRLAVIDYHSVCDVVGEGRNITHEQFLRDMAFISERMADGLETVTPLDLMKETGNESSYNT